MRRLFIALTLGVLVAAPSVADTVKGVVECEASCDNVVVYLEGPAAESGTAAEALFDQRNKVFIPHVLPIAQGTKVNIKNGDPFLHNVHIYSGSKTVLNLAMPFPEQVVQHTFEEPGTYKVLCDAHPEMSAFIVVLPHRFFTRPNEDGSFEIADVPQGTYTLVVEDPERGTRSGSEVVVN